MLNIIRNCDNFYLASVPSGFIPTDGSKYNFITTAINYLVTDDGIPTKSYIGYRCNLFKSLLSDTAKDWNSNDRVLPISIKSYLFMSNCLLKSKVRYNKRNDTLLKIK